MPDIFSVIADPTRRDILQILLERQAQGQQMSVSDIVAKLETSQPTVSKHLKVLRDAELVSVREEGQHRFYEVTPEPLEMVEDFILPFLSSGFDTEVTVEYVTEETEPPISEEMTAAAEGLGRAAARAEHQVKELVARFRLRA